MSRITDLLNANRGAFDLLTDTLTVRNYIEDGSPDSYGDRAVVEHPDSPQTAAGVTQLRGRPSVESDPAGIETEADARIFIDVDAFVTSGGEDWQGERVEYTEIEDVDGTVYRVVSETDRGGPFRECLGRSDDA